MSGALRIAVLTEAGRGAGLGHLRRCLALSAAATELGAQARLFVAGDMPAGLSSGSAKADLEPCGWTTSPESALAAVDRWPADVVVVDSYAAAAELLERLGARVLCLVLVDDLADRPTPVDVVVNGGYHAGRLHYQGRPETVYLLGPRYALLDVAFAKRPVRAAAGPVRRVLVTLGGDAPGDLLEMVVTVARQAAPGAELDVVVGPFTTGLPVADDRIRVHRSLNSLRPLLLTVDVAVTAGGMTLYECLAAGTPIVAIAIADNQRPNVESLGSAGLLIDGGPGLEPAIARLATDAGLREIMSRRGREVVDGGGAGRVAREIERIAVAGGLAGRP